MPGKGLGMKHQMCWEALASSSPSTSQKVSNVFGAPALSEMFPIEVGRGFPSKICSGLTPSLPWCFASKSRGSSPLWHCWGGPCSQKSSRWGFPLPSTGCNSRFLLSIPVGPQPCPFHHSCLGAGAAQGCYSRQQERCAWGKCHLLFLWAHLDTTRSYCHHPVPQFWEKAGLERALNLLASFPGTRVSPKTAPGSY